MRVALHSKGLDDDYEHEHVMRSRDEMRGKIERMQSYKERRERAGEGEGERERERATGSLEVPNLQIGRHRYNSKRACCYAST